ncbi:hypothetical protein BUALT_Bualt11G0013100 [Buddleja alternifolia]|uniref:SAP domain-containing protein n=1 Tax=Buddleja alternifolia TaxID=168488 RepID=A0AAV6WQP2_9LAMI|nr:hypothetical protein BUALT_Bualt11G0013100 [Buddleja alternifolia]
MSSPYVTLGNRSLEQWKVTELKEELKKRKLTTKGLKEDLIKRLDEAVRIELKAEVENMDNGLNDTNKSEIPSEQPKTESVVSGKSEVLVEKVDSNPENEVDDHKRSLAEGKLMETDFVQAAGMEGEQIDHFATVTTTVVVSETVETVETLSGSQLQSDGKAEGGDSTAVLDNDGLRSSQEDTKIELSDPSTQVPQVNESSLSNIPSLQDSETQNEARSSTVEIENDDSKSLPPDSNVQPLKYQVSEVDPDLGSQVISDSVSTESVSIIEKNELKVDVITDNVKLELSSVVPDGVESHPMDVEEPLNKKDEPEPIDKKVVEEPVDEKVPMEETGGSNVQNVDSLKNIDSGDSGPPEKLNLDRSSGDDSMEEDILESKHVEYNSNSDKIEDNVEKSEMPIVKEDIDVDVVGLDKPVETKVADAEIETLPVQASVKRKFHDKEAVGNNDAVKRPRRWNVESMKSSEPQSVNVASTTPKDLSEPIFKRLSGTDSAVNEEAPKERIVPPSSKPPTNSLRIDRFLRPFTLKAVQELLGKTGTVNSFWMDQIKTHCYVSYSSVEEAVETRNAVYNLQWPPNGGRLLVAEFVDPQEVKTRTEAPPASPATPSTPTFSAAQQPPNQPSPRQQLLRQQLPPPSLPPPPPPPLSNPPPIRERLHPSQPLPVRDRLNLPPPPPLPEKVDAPIVTLDDLFKKTKAIPRIYYLPLSDEQVAAKVKAQGKNNVNQ